MPRLIEAEAIEFRDIVRPGDTVAWTSGTGEPLSLTTRLIAQRHDIGAFRLLLGTLYSDTIRPEHCDVISVMSLGGVGTARHLAAAGCLDVLTVHYTDLSELIRRRALRVDVALVQVSEHPESGEWSYGAVSGYAPDLVAAARVVIAEVNEQAPWTHSHVPVDRDRITLAVRTSQPLIELPERAVSAADAEIGRRVADLVAEEAVIQIGIGAIPRAVLAALRGHRNLGVLSGTIGDDIVALIEAGVITNASRVADPGVTVTGTLLGTRRLYDFAHRNRAVRVEPVRYTHDFDVLRACTGLVAINSAIEVDLTGQINAEVAGEAYVGAIGGQSDFMRGARAAPGGRSIIALPSVAGKARRSRIVARIPSGVVTSPRSDVDYVVTEHGTARLRGLGLTERVSRMIGIAHPDAREALEREAFAIPGLRTTKN